jgi:hypothetical protein
MFIPIAQLPPSSKVWIYQANQRFTAEQEDKISSALQAFTTEWEVHGSPLPASFEIRFNQFVVIAANDTASGCSIDASVRVMKDIGALTGLDFFDRNLVAIKGENGVDFLPLKELKSSFRSGLWNEHSLFFNNAISSLADYHISWPQEAGKTWLKRYFFNESVVK